MAERTLTKEEVDALPHDLKKQLGLTTRAATPEEARAAGVDVPDVPPPPAGVDPGLWRSIVLQFGAGAMKQGMDELSGEVAQHAPGTIPGNETYRKARDAVRADLDAAQREHFWPSLGANMLGDITSDALLSKLGVPVTSQEYQTGVGALSGLLGSKGELTEDKTNRDEALRALIDTGAGGTMAYLLPKVGQQAARLGAPLLRKVGGGLEKAAIGLGRRVIGGDSDIAAATREALPDEAVLRALEEKLIPVGGTTASTYRNIDTAAEKAAAEYGDILKRLDELGVTGPRATALAAQFMKRANELRATTLPGNTGPGIMAKTARAMGKQGEMSTDIPLLVTEELKRNAQKMGRHERLRNTPGEEAYQEIGSTLRQAIEDEVAAAGAGAGEGSELAQLAGDFKPTKERLAELLSARTVGERGASKALQKSPVSMKDYLLGAATGDPGSAAFTALATSTMRNRLPSALARGAYGLSRGAGQDTLSAGARAAIHQPATIQALTDWLTADPRKAQLQALMDYLQKTKDDNR